MIHVLRRQLEIIESYYLKSEMNIFDNSELLRPKSMGFIPFICVDKSKITWYLLEDLSIEVTNGNILGLRKFIDYIETYYSSKKELKALMVKYLSEVGLT